MTLTFELIRDIIKVNASTKFWVSASNASTVRALTDRQTDGTDSIPSTADVEGNNIYDDVILLHINFFITDVLCKYHHVK